MQLDGKRDAARIKERHGASGAFSHYEEPYRSFSAINVNCLHALSR